MRLIPPPTQRKQTATPYSALLQHVLNVRLFNLNKFFFFASLAVGVVLVYYKKWAAPTLFAIAFLVSINRKGVAHCKPVVDEVLALQLWRRLVSKRFVLNLGFYVVEALLFYSTFLWSTKNKLYKLVLVASIQRDARGLPEPLRAKYLPHNWIQLDENVTYNVFATSVVALTSCIAHTLRDGDLLNPHGPDIPPRDLILKKTKIVNRKVTKLGLYGAALPVLYFLTRPIILLPFKLFHLSGYRVSGTSGWPSLQTVVVNHFKLAALVWIWEFANTCFDIYLSRGPMHCGALISEGSKLPNHTLVNGLQSKRYTLSNLEAWRELQYIGEFEKSRRVSIYSDVSSETVIWKQVFRTWDSYIQEVQKSLPIPEPKKELEQKRTKSVVAGQPVSSSLKGERLIRISNDNVLSDPAPSFSERLVKKLQSHDNKALVIGERLKNIETTIKSVAHSYAKLLLDSKYGTLLRKSTATIFEMKVADYQVVGCANEAIAALIARSLDEDPLGYVQVDIAAVLKTLDEFLTALDKLPANEHSASYQVVKSSATESFDLIARKFAPYFDNLRVDDKVRARCKYL